MGNNINVNSITTFLIRFAPPGMEYFLKELKETEEGKYWREKAIEWINKVPRRQTFIASLPNSDVVVSALACSFRVDYVNTKNATDATEIHECYRREIELMDSCI